MVVAGDRFARAFVRWWRNEFLSMSAFDRGNYIFDLTFDVYDVGTVSYGHIREVRFVEGYPPKLEFTMNFNIYATRKSVRRLIESLPDDFVVSASFSHDHHTHYKVYPLSPVRSSKQLNEVAGVIVDAVRRAITKDGFLDPTDIKNLYIDAVVTRDKDAAYLTLRVMAVIPDFHKLIRKFDDIFEFEKVVSTVADNDAEAYLDLFQELADHSARAEGTGDDHSSLKLSHPLLNLFPARTSENACVSYVRSADDTLSTIYVITYCRGDTYVRVDRFPMEAVDTNERRRIASELFGCKATSSYFIDSSSSSYTCDVKHFKNKDEFEEYIKRLKEEFELRLAISPL